MIIHFCCQLQSKILLCFYSC